MDNTGKEVHRSSTKNQIPQIDMNPLSSRIYLVSLKYENGVQVEKIIKK